MVIEYKFRLLGDCRSPFFNRVIHAARETNEDKPYFRVFETACGIRHVNPFYIYSRYTLAQDSDKVTCKNCLTALRRAELNRYVGNPCPDCGSTGYTAIPDKPEFVECNGCFRLKPINITLVKGYTLN